VSCRKVWGGRWSGRGRGQLGGKETAFWRGRLASGRDNLNIGGPVTLTVGTKGRGERIQVCKGPWTEKKVVVTVFQPTRWEHRDQGRAIGFRSFNSLNRLGGAKGLGV